MKISVLGASGRMGSAIVQLLGDDLHTAVSHTSPSYEQDLKKACQADALIDFSLPEGVLKHIDVAKNAGTPYMTGSTGFQDFSFLEEAAKDIPVFYAPNTSLGVAILKKLVEQTAAALDETYDIEILETHHRSKKDAPSGTALAIGKAAAKGRGRTLKDSEKTCRTGERHTGDIGFAALRAGKIVADCSALFAGDEEFIELKHSALTRDVFAKGAIRAARWLVPKKPGLYGMEDMI